MSDRRERIPAAEVPDPKLWKLPFWTEPKHIIHAEEEDVIEAEEDISEVLIEDEEIEVEPLTIEQLETIRQEAYNEGLDQGLVEGRQKGEKQGYTEGHVEGLAAGKIEGNKLGYDDGFLKGEKAALAEGDDKSAQLTSRIQANMRNIEKSINEQKSAIEKILPDLVISIAEVVISEELDQGSEHIVSLVNEVVNSLPIDSQGLTVECNSLDLPFLEAAQEKTDFEGKLKVSDTIQPGGCKVKSKYSSIDFTLSERWESVVKQYRQQLQLGFSQLDDIQKNQAEEDRKIEESLAEAEKIEAQETVESLDNSQPEVETQPSEEKQNSDLESSDRETRALDDGSDQTFVEPIAGEQELEHEATEASEAHSEITELQSSDGSSDLLKAESSLPNAALEETAVDELVVDESITDESVTDESVTDESVTDESVTDESVTDESITDEENIHSASEEELASDDDQNEAEDDMSDMTKKDIEDTLSDDEELGGENE